MRCSKRDREESKNKRSYWSLRCRNPCRRNLSKKEQISEVVKIKSRYGLCGWPGITCARDAQKFARDVESGKVDLEAAKAECHAPGGDCDVVQKQLDQLEATLAKAVEDVYKLD